MADKSWKSFERRVAARVGGRRLACTGEKDGVDVAAHPFVYQCKLRRGLPSYLRDWLKGIVAAGERSDGATGVVVWKAPAQETMTPWCSYGSRIGKPGMARRILKVKKPAENESGGPFDAVHEGEAPARRPLRLAYHALPS